MKIDGYEIKDRMNTDSSTEVYKAVRSKDKTEVVVKYIPILDELHPAVVNLRNEYEILSYLSSEKMIRAFGMEKIPEGFILILEFVPGQSLKHFSQKRPVNLKDFFKIAIDLAEKLGEIHNKKVIHKDLKPDNIIFNPDENILRIVDFGISTRLSKEESSWSNPNRLEGSIHYVSPEQTGRMNRSVDYRSDFYSLGITFYELLTGKLPFESEDLLELVHFHLAKSPVDPRKIRSEIPEALSHVILKLLSKTAEERYQTSEGLKNDLEIIRDKWLESGDAPAFPLGSTDYSHEFKIPQKLYGRESYIEALLNEFKRMTETGRPSIVLIAGYSGVGKSSLVKEINKPLTESKGYSISGKFDQYNRNVPFSAIIQVFSNLIEQILTESPERIEEWKNKIRDTLGANGKVITDVLPELEFIIGEQPPVTELGPQENANRFYLVFQNFIKIFANQDHPLAIFLDDLQWADTPSLELVKNLIEDASVNYLFLILAYRDNEVDSTHPFSALISGLEKEGFRLDKILLKPLSLENVNELLSDSLRRPTEETMSFAEIVYSKTRGNPFFINELLKQLSKEEIISYQKGSPTDSGRWVWNLEKIKNTNISDNVVELLVNRIKKLPPRTQETLKLASCIGSNFDLAIQAKILGATLKETAEALMETMQEELIVPIGDNYRLVDSMVEIEKNQDKNFQIAKSIQFRFQHDRVQQASYELLNDDQKQSLRLQIGRILLENLNEKTLEDSIFDVVNHLNTGSTLITDNSEKRKLLQLNLQAAQKAKLSAAYKPSKLYCLQAKELLSFLCKSEKDCWNQEYDLSYAVHKELAEVLYLNGDFEESQETIQDILKQAKTPVEQAEAYNLLMIEYSAQGKYDLAMPTVIKALKPLGIELPTSGFDKVVKKELEEAKKNLKNRSITSLLDAPTMTDPSHIWAVNLLISAIPMAYNKEPALFPVICLKMANLLLKFGNLSDSYGYSCYGMVLVGQGDYKGAYDFCELAVKLSEKYINSGGYTKAANILANYSSSFVKHLKFSEEINIKCVQSALDSGEFLHGSYAAMNDASNVLFQGKNLEILKPKINELLKFVRKVKNNLAIDTILGTTLILSNLRGETGSHLDFSSTEYLEKEYIDLCNDHQSLAPICTFKVMKVRSLLMYGEYQLALQEAEETNGMILYLGGQYGPFEYNFLYSLALAANYKKVSPDRKKESVKKIRENQKQLLVLAESCPENFYHKYLLVEAELARLEYKNWKAARTYEAAIREARKNEFQNDEALACENAALFWLSKGSVKIAGEFINEAYHRYGLWGANLKQSMLKSKYPEFIRERGTGLLRTHRTISSTTSTATEIYSGQTLDLQSVLKSSTAISGEIKLENLLDKLMKIVIENAGAQRGVLILKKEGKLYVEAEGSISKDDVEVLTGIPLGSSKNLPISLIYYVERTKENLVLRNASQDEKFNKDEYIKNFKTKSILCTPVIKQGEISGILYLENNLSEGAFTSDRLQIMNILSSQAAISIDNALLYSNMEEKVRERTRELAQANADLELKNQRITDSITYSLNIQQAILPSDDILAKNLKDQFVLFRPKDIVSGDFYWFSKKEGSIFLAAVDCTGHGVPGALMSMIGNTLLNQIVNEAGIKDPGKVLEHLNRNVRQALKQDTLGANSSDGMDICFCRIDEDKVLFAGAKRPLYFSKGNHIEEIKGDKHSIGGRQKEVSRTYSTHEVKLEKGQSAMFYLTTDGFMDQPNPQRQRITSKGLIARLQNVLSLPAYEQKNQLAAFLDEYQAGEAQRDDITLIGFRV
ncbi:protein kinase domain-containing protein [Leptospira interrogans]|uniref:protein kinase domain-containing protein n=1 Tax=Leptospira interrogans TaxID=173 RepID=UPI0002783B4C|nr:AAA family ATPase [Leptospira interrogans]EJP05308.1 stage II sporulation protein E [Leptospira interrogans serovar Bulgarica str. Mallika]EMN08168.1 stage II sporulation protein E [Leptospira interrogans serovar Muenchen str. Brem 129]KLO77048.1 Stage II sporulation protein E [Leptospira interrogans serovar Muenchen]KWV23311.1 serine/threonine kinase protein [Leptospira interrogans]KWV25268.1 serine/threonine kinase protein [Leptospira interrogans]